MIETECVGKQRLRDAEFEKRRLSIRNPNANINTGTLTYLAESKPEGIIPGRFPLITEKKHSESRQKKVRHP